MSDPAPQKKKNKNKKKKKQSADSDAPVPAVPAQVPQNDAEKDAFSINEVLPQKVGMKTVFKDVEVTMTHSGNATEAVNGISKKKKKKKKSKQPPAEEAPPPIPTPAESEEQNNFFKFSENHIELVNHPEISVTLSKSTEAQEKKSPESKPEVSVGSENIPPAATASSKKKKKKKKKKSTTTDSSLPTTAAVSAPDTTDSSYTAPTYVKLPAAGDSCVLLVSHESFSGDNKVSENNTKETAAPSNTATVLIQNKERIAESRATPQLKPEIQPEASISIIPVTAPTVKTDGLNMDTCLQKVGDLIKKETNGVEAATPKKTENETNAQDSSMPTKAQLKAERRAKQEAQRAAKLAKDTGKDSSQSPAPPNTNKSSTAEKKPAQTKQTTPPVSSGLTSTKESTKSSTETVFRKGQIFSHLPQSQDLSKQLTDKYSKIHPAILELGSHYNKGILCGSNARCVGFLAAFREVIRDYKAPPNKEFSRDLESKLQTYLNFLNKCRPLPVSINNSVRFLKHQINHIPKGVTEEKAKEELCIAINSFVREEILLANEAICISATAKIVDGDCIIVTAYSSLVKDVLCKAHDQNKSFHVIVIDSRPKMEGLEMLRRLVKHGLQCSYASISSVTSFMKKVSKVIIGAHAILSNGSVMSRLGCKQLAQIASSYSVPVLVCCETYKFCERALTDSFVHNELGRPEDLVQISLNKNESLKNWQSLSSLQLYNILYDVTPSELVSVVITEKGLLPCTSVPVVLRVKNAGLQE